MYGNSCGMGEPRTDKKYTLSAVPLRLREGHASRGTGAAPQWCCARGGEGVAPAPRAAARRDRVGRTTSTEKISGRVTFFLMGRDQESAREASRGACGA